MAVTATGDFSGPFAPDGATTVFPFNFAALSADEVSVVRMSATGVQTPLTGYTVTLQPDRTGSVIFSVAPSAGDPIYIVSNPSFEQQTTFANQSSFSASVLGTELDRAAIRDIALAAAVSRAVLAPPTENLGVLPSASVRAGRYLAFDSSGLATVASGTGADAGLRADLAAPGGASLVNGVVTGAIRQRLSSDVTYYVRNDGSDANNGLTNVAGGAFQTLQHAADFVFNSLDLNGHSVTIQAADGARTAGFRISSPQVGEGNIYIFGNVANPSACPVTVTGADAFHVENNAVIWLRGFKVSTITSGAGVVAYTGAVINTQAMDFGACAASQIECGQGATINLDGVYSISGGAVSHFHVGSFGLITNAGAFTVPITGTPNFSSYFVGVAQGHVIVPGITWSGSATGRRYLAHFGGLIRGAAIEPAFPGDVQGLANAGGYYIASVINPQRIAPDVSLNGSVEIAGHNTTTGNQVPRFVTRADATGSANFFCDSDNSYSSGETWFGNTQRVVAGAVAAQDGATFYSKAALASNFPVAEMSSNGAPCIRMGRRNSDGTILLFHRDTAGVGSISVTTTATAYNTSSDYRLKEDPQPIDDALVRIAALKPYNFAWKVNGERTEGFFAHELATVIPQAVTGEKDATDENGPVYQAVDQSKIVPLLVAGMQQLLIAYAALKDGK